MTTHYHQTTPLTETQLIGAQRVAKTQDERILALFRAHPWRKLSPRQVESALDAMRKAHGGPVTPLLTSIRRALSNLTRAGLLIHHVSLHVPGPHGRPETLWQLDCTADQRRTSGGQAEPCPVEIPAKRTAAGAPLEALGGHWK